MKSFKSMHVFLPLSIVCLLSLHAVAAHRKLNINKPPIKRLLMSSSSSNFYNAFDTPNTGTIASTHPQTHDKLEGNGVKETANEFKDVVDSEFNAKGYTEAYDAKGFSNSYNNGANFPFRTTTTDNNNANLPFSTSNSYGNNADLPYSTINTHYANGGQYSYPTTYEFSAPSTSSTPSLYGGKFPSSFEASFPDARTGYGKQSFPSNNQQDLYNSPSSLDAKSFFYKFPSKVDASRESKEEGFFKSPSNYGTTSYDPFHGGDINKSKANDFDERNNHVSDFEYKNEKPVFNYDSFFNSPTIHQNEVEGSSTTTQFGRPEFPFSPHDLTYGHVQVP